MTDVCIAPRALRGGALLALGLIALAFGAGCAGDRDLPVARASAAECAELQQRLIGLRMETVTADRAQHEANLRSALGASFTASCQTQMTRAEVLCASSAVDLDAMAACSSAEGAQ